MSCQMSVTLNLYLRMMTAEITDFEHHEFNHDPVFTNKYISCFIYTLQLIVKIFESIPSFRSSLKTAYSIV